MGDRAQPLALALTLMLVLTVLPPVGAGSTTHTVAPGEDIQAVVDAASPGDTVLLAPGVFHQSVKVHVEDLTLAGSGPGVSVLDGTRGNDTIDENGISVTADGVTVRNLTVQEFGGNGVVFYDQTGFYVENVAAHRNSPYGIYAFESRIGHFRDSVATGHADSGFYVGNVRSCQCVIEGVLAEGNLIGYSGTAASQVTIRDSVFRDNAAGVVPNVLPTEPNPQLYLYVHDNRIVDNNNETASEMWHFGGIAHVPAGLGVVIAGGSANLVTDNVITGHHLAGVAVTWLFTEPSLNEVVDNDLDNPATPDHPRARDIVWDGGGVNNCFEANGDPTFDAGVVWNTLGTLPDCQTPNAAPPDPGQLARTLSLVLMGCEPDDQPGEPCHVEGA